LGCVGHASSAHVSSDISTAEEETVDGVGGGLASGGVVEFDVSGGVGGEGREEGLDIESVDAILGDGTILTDVVEVSLCSRLSDQVEEEESKHGKEQEGHGENIQGSHFDDKSLCERILVFIDTVIGAGVF
jgi:hypothetical protein